MLQDSVLGPFCQGMNVGVGSSCLMSFRSGRAHKLECRLSHSCTAGVP